MGDRIESFLLLGVIGIGNQYFVPVNWPYNVFSGGLYPSDTGNISKYCLMLPWRQNHLQLQPLGFLHNKAPLKTLISMNIILITESIVSHGEWILWQNLLTSYILDNCLVFFFLSKQVKQWFCF